MLCECSMMLSGSPDTERQLLAAIKKATVAQLGAGIMALLVQAEQQVSHWSVLAFHCTVLAFHCTVLSISTASCFSLQFLYLFTCHIARLRPRCLSSLQHPRCC